MVWWLWDDGTVVLVGALALVWLLVFAGWLAWQVRKAPQECVNCQARADGRGTIVRRRRYGRGVYALCTSCWLVWRRGGGTRA